MTESCHDAVSAGIERACAELRAGRLVVLPTETVYGLAGDADDRDAVARIYALKGRPASRPVIVHLAAAAALDDWCLRVPDYARRLAARHWPGPLTLVLPRAPRVGDWITAGQASVAVRVPDQPLATRVLERFGGGLAAPSANRYGHVSPTTVAHVRAEFGAETPFCLDGGPCRVGIESTIVSCLGEAPVLLRAGMLAADTLAATSGLPVGTGGAADAVVPGQVPSHYAPRTPARLVPAAGLRAAIATAAGPVGVLCFTRAYAEAAACVRLPADPARAARDLYAALRELDAAGVCGILVEVPPSVAAWAAIADRLQRACGTPVDDGT